LLGTRQTGLPDYRITDLVRDAELMPQVQASAEIIQRENPAAGHAIIRRWLGDAYQYGKV
jgi:ATP-dependent DNA helicase RecG